MVEIDRDDGENANLDAQICLIPLEHFSQIEQDQTHHEEENLALDGSDRLCLCRNAAEEGVGLGHGQTKVLVSDAHHALCLPTHCPVLARVSESRFAGRVCGRGLAHNYLTRADQREEVQRGQFCLEDVRSWDPAWGTAGARLVLREGSSSLFKTEPTKRDSIKNTA